MGRDVMSYRQRLIKDRERRKANKKRIALLPPERGWNNEVVR